MNAPSPAPAARSSWFFKLLIAASALFIAGCSAFFSVRGLGLLFIGSSTAVMIMAASLEVGKLVTASFLYRYWSRITLPLRLYLTLAVIVLIAITSLGNYGYLARAYEVTHTQLADLEQRILPLQQDIAATQARIDASRDELGKFTDTGREDRDKVQSQTALADQDLAQSLSRLEDRRKAAKDRQDHDSQTLSARLPEAAELLKTGLAAEDTAISKLNDRVAVLDRAVDAYTARGGPGFFKDDDIKKGQDLLRQQSPERQSISADIVSHQDKQDQLRADYAQTTGSINHDLTAVQTLYHQDLAALDTEEQTLRQTHADRLAKIDRQVSTLQTQDKTVSRQGADQISGLHQRIDADTQEIARLRQQIAAVDIGPYRFIARTFNVNADDVVKWLVLLLVSVFDPLAVILTVGLNIALLTDRHPAAGSSAPPAPRPPRRSRAARLVTWALLLLLLAALAATALRYGPALLSHWRDRAAARATASLIPPDSFVVLSLRPSRLHSPAGDFSWNQTAATLLGKTALARLAPLFGGSLDADSDVYLFVKYPSSPDPSRTQTPVILCGLVARLKNPATAETGLDAFADSFADSLHPPTATAPARRHDMVRYGDGRYLDPQGNFLSFALTDTHAIILLEIDGDPARPSVETELRALLSPAPASTDTGLTARATPLPPRALGAGAPLSLWFDSARCFAAMPKNPAAETRYQQLSPRLDFDLLLSLDPATPGQLGLLADYRYNTDRFGTRPLPPLADILRTLGPAAPAGVPGLLMDRCAVTLDLEGLMDRLPALLSDTAQVRVEKTITSPGTGRLDFVARYDTKTGASLQSALSTLLR